MFQSGTRAHFKVQSNPICTNISFSISALSREDGKSRNMEKRDNEIFIQSPGSRYLAIQGKQLHRATAIVNGKIGSTQRKKRACIGKKPESIFMIRITNLDGGPTFRVISEAQILCFAGCIHSFAFDGHNTVLDTFKLGPSSRFQVAGWYLGLFSQALQSGSHLHPWTLMWPQQIQVWLGQIHSRRLAWHTKNSLLYLCRIPCTSVEFPVLNNGHWSNLIVCDSERASIKADFHAQTTLISILAEHFHVQTTLISIHAEQDLCY